MIFKTLEVGGLWPAIHGMRNPKNSWKLSDTCRSLVTGDDGVSIRVDIGPKDLTLAQKLIKGGSVHSKFMRQIMVWVDITAPIYWWSEFDTYKVGVVRDSCSTMHTLIATIQGLKNDSEFVYWTEHPDLKHPPASILNLYETSDISDEDCTVEAVSQATLTMFKLILSKDVIGLTQSQLKRALKKILPSSWLQMSTISMSYENIRNMVIWRRNHELPEWHAGFTNWVRTLPYAKELILYGLEEDACD